MADAGSDHDAQAPRLRRADAVIAEIAAGIGAGALEPGSRLPTEPQLMERFGVSRTVIREAVAELRARGLVRAVQGSGVYVSDAPPQPGIDQSGPILSAAAFQSIPQVLEMIEYRAGIECQAAWLAAERATPAEVFAIRDLHEAMTRAVDRRESTVEIDRALHLAIATAAHNSLFSRALQGLGRAAIPRSILPDGGEGVQDRAYLHSVIEEHAAIVEAIAARDPETARAAMQLHLGRSLRRYEGLARLARAARQI